MLSITLAADQDGMGALLVLPADLKEAEEGLKKTLEGFAKELKKLEWAPLEAGSKTLCISI